MNQIRLINLFCLSHDPVLVSHFHATNKETKYTGEREFILQTTYTNLITWITLNVQFPCYKILCKGVVRVCVCVLVRWELVWWSKMGTVLQWWYLLTVMDTRGVHYITLSSSVIKCLKFLKILSQEYAAF